MCRYKTFCSEPLFCSKPLIEQVECNTENEFSCSTFMSMREHIRNDIVHQYGQMQLDIG